MLASHLKGTKHKTVATAVSVHDSRFFKDILRCCFFFHSQETDKFKHFSEKGTPHNTFHLSHCKTRGMFLQQCSQTARKKTSEYSEEFKY